MTTTDSAQTTQVFRIYVKAAPERVWEAITDPEWNARYGYAAPQFFELRPGGRFHSEASEGMRKASAEMGWPCPDVIVDGEVLESDPPHRLVQTWRMLMDPTTAAEPMTTLTWTITPSQGGSKLTLTHDVTGAPATAAMVSGALDEDAGQGGGGWSWVLSDLKSLLETGSTLAG
ncbi:transcriptional regulator [Modestobacter sp. I12A-02628]|uniref:SRPBCC domain-containing protein n=1 Tax=Goekera deserti TaxID=2497753 RepID=UPI00141CF640|nr:SRPBCC domain-containing protein [Goekera deserti]MPQ96760.1 transcriptional regulator [Goekera deserti]